jgi:Ni,Fe-hydrogenase III small subunit
MRRFPVLDALFVRRVTEASPGKPKGATPRFPGSVQLRHVDAGSCNGCEVEIAQAFAPVCDAGRFGIRLVSSPRHADGLLVTGVVTNNMAVPLTKTLEAVPRPRVVVACGDCAVGEGVFSNGYGVAGSVGDVVLVDIEIRGCPPEPTSITDALRELTGR